VPSAYVWYLPNFVPAPQGSHCLPNLPGRKGKRIVCVANFRPEKDHLTLVDAMEQLTKVEPEATLLLVGSESNEVQASRVRESIHRKNLERNIFLLGSRNDVRSILSACDIGVLSSVSEGMPLALLEYGMAGLPTVATRIGQIPEVLDEGRAGLLVAPRQPNTLCDALRSLLSSPESQARFGKELNRRVEAEYGEETIIRRLIGIYSTVLDRDLTRDGFDGPVQENARCDLDTGVRNHCA
jgi:glycosyltransferase involved in cell wall biosynthesis